MDMEPENILESEIPFGDHIFTFHVKLEERIFPNTG